MAFDQIGQAGWYQDLFPLNPDADVVDHDATIPFGALKDIRCVNGAPNVNEQWQQMIEFGNLVGKVEDVLTCNHVRRMNFYSLKLILILKTTIRTFVE